MIRSPLFYPMVRGMDSEAGGAADLQTDVMRFMAILSLCLMVIFALVQSVPVETTQVPSPQPPPQPLPEEPVEKQIDTPPPVETKQMVVVAPPPLARTAVKMKVVPPIAQPPPAPSTKEETPEGFTLRFESDRALTSLVARGEIGLYAITSGEAMRMTINQDRVEFWSASYPKQYHQMESATVPDTVIRALGISADNSAASTQWGVTLPTVMSGKLRQYMQDYRGGSLVIGADGILRMEH